MSARAARTLAPGHGWLPQMGWGGGEYLGMPALAHDGETSGFTAEMLLLPASDLGIVVLTNRALAVPFYTAVQQFAAETALGLSHAGDDEQLAENEQTLNALRELSAQIRP